ncbi:hypothetical protein CTAYLR_004140 [Chrysophaeum taylorii]|uniref:Fe2OG dioxygenase domain-containing protein n=1 Tax=Chrysophaeum taylorii TaxID=2483200 RepID=A0AAD7UMF4_9STRA|nr:hypothetical protein CTAYLR_004140 [Chrysophaeum taylorii]
MRWVAALLVLERCTSLSTPFRRLLGSGLSDMQALVAAEAARQATGIEHRLVKSTARISGLSERRFLLVEDAEQQTLDDVAAAMDACNAGTVLSLGAPSWGGNDPQSAIDAAAVAYVDRYHLATPVATHETTWEPGVARVAAHVELDGARRDDFDGRWDVSEVVVVDGLVDEPLRAALLSCLGGEPLNPRTWVRGGLSDVAGRRGSSWGLRPAHLEWLCGSRPPDALVELQTRLNKWFQSCNPNPIVSRMPEACFGGDVPPIAANAPVASDAGTFGYHVDADPFLLPPSPFTDFFGYYVNRAAAKPRWVSALVYLSPDWPLHFGAPTRFLDPPSKRTVDVAPTPGRVVLLDQDVSHCVVAPRKVAGHRPRFSLVLKLLVHPAHPLGASDGDATVRLAPPFEEADLKYRRHMRVGSAARGPSAASAAEPWELPPRLDPVGDLLQGLTVP